MSDLSLPLLLPALHALQESQEPKGAAATAAFAWPIPDLLGPRNSDADWATDADLACEIEGLNGHTTVGRLSLFDPERSLLQLRLPTSRSSVVLRFDQFRRLRLTEPLPVLPGPEESAPANLLLQRPAVPFRVAFRDHVDWEGLTFGHREQDCGLFLFEPLPGGCAVQRLFIPSTAYYSAEIGLRIGEALVAEMLLTPEQLTETLAEQQLLRQRRLGSLLMLQQVISPEELHAAIEQQARMPMVRIGEALTALGFITEAQLQEALVQQRADRNVPLGELLVKKGLVSRSDLQTALARKMGFPLVDVEHFPTEDAAVARLPQAVATRIPALPLMLRNGRLVVALEDPINRRHIEELEFAARCRLVPVLARCGTLPEAIAQAYRKAAGTQPGTAAADKPLAPAAGLATNAPTAAGAGRPSTASRSERNDRYGPEASDAPIEASDPRLVHLVNTMIEAACAQGVSDIHIESQPGREPVLLRFRKDGQLFPYQTLPHTHRGALMVRLKVMFDLDISERRKPQEGKINFKQFVPGAQLELRLTTLPTHSQCEDAVLRLLAPGKALALEQLNLSPRHLERLKRAAHRGSGLLLCVGTAGSGRTTSLHAVLNLLNTPERKLWTVEDPIEITQAGLRQVQINAKLDWTCAKALSSVLQADPDVILVGDIRDRETAKLAIEAALTGHLVLGSLHASSAAEAVSRLLEMGVDPFNLADALVGVLGQRLVRRLCTQCRAASPANADEEQELLYDHRHAIDALPSAPSAKEVLSEWRERFGSHAGADRDTGGDTDGDTDGDAGREGQLMRYQARGCAHCGGTGYRGRLGLHELMIISRDLRHVVHSGSRASDLQQLALAEGMRTLRQDGIEKVLAGLTTIEEVRAAS